MMWANERIYASFVPLAMLSSENGAWSVPGSQFCGDQVIMGTEPRALMAESHVGSRVELLPPQQRQSATIAT